MLPLWSQILGWLLTIVTVTGNGLVIYLITTKRKLRTKTNWFVLSLAVADFGVGAIYFPRFSSCWIGDSCAGQVIVRLAYSVGAFFNYASVTNLCALTLDRYLAIVKPLRYATFVRKKRVALLLLAAWSVAFVVLIYSIVLFLVLVPGKPREIMERYVSILFVALSVCVCVFLLFATTRIFLIVRKHSRRNAVVVAQLNYNYTSQHTKVLKPQEAAASRMIGIVVAVFLVCYFLDVFGILYEEPTDTFFIVKALFVLMNAAVNPLVYALLKREIRREVQRLCCCRKRQAVKPAPTNSSHASRIVMQNMRN